jgi:kynurenine formamidase
LDADIAVARLAQVLSQAAPQATLAGSSADGYGDVDVVAVKVGTGAPCSSHAAMFEDWPGPERHVGQWFVLANGKAVGIDDDPDGGPILAVVDYST